MNRLRSLRSETGMTLVEVLITISILGIAVVGILSGLGSTSRASHVHRRHVDLDVVVRSYAEAIKEKVRLGGYVNCATENTYNNAGIYTPPAGHVVSQATPQYQTSSALNVVLVLDRSTSIAKANAVEQVKNAGTAFLTALKDTGSRVAIVSFGTQGKIEAPPTAVTDGANFTYLNNIVRGITIPMNPTEYTNWDDGLIKARSTFASFPPGRSPLVVMVTDGNPNRWISDTTGGVSGSDETTAVNHAKNQATAMKSSPTNAKVFAVGVSANPDTNNLKGISGPNQWQPGKDFQKADWTVAASFDQLEAVLKGVATDAAAETFSDVCPNPDQGSQLLTIKAATVDGRHSETVQIVVRRP
jgi:prepilin-type N-terminal cleavage/methylation domain-containing protein